MAQMIADTVGQAWANFLQSLALYLPRVLATLSIVIVGGVIAALLRVLTRWLLRWTRFDALSERVGLAPVLKSADFPPASVLAGTVVFWLVFLGFLVSGIEVLGLAALQGLVAGFGAFVPRLVVALAILAVGLVVANFAWRATLLAAVNARMASPRLLSNAVRALVLLLVVAMALEQLAVAQTVVLTAFAIAFGAVMAALAIAFGVGGGSLARRFLEQQFPERPPADPDQVSHL
jgi:hypothetical protein